MDKTVSESAGSRPVAPHSPSRGQEAEEAVGGIVEVIAGIVGDQVTTSGQVNQAKQSASANLLIRRTGHDTFIHDTSSKQTSPQLITSSS